MYAFWVAVPLLFAVFLLWALVRLLRSHRGDGRSAGGGSRDATAGDANPLLDDYGHHRYGDSESQAATASVASVSTGAAGAHHAGGFDGGWSGGDGGGGDGGD